MENLQIGEKIMYCFTMNYDPTQGVVVFGTIFDVREKAYGFVCEECLLDDSGNGIYKYLSKIKDKTYGNKEFCYRVNKSYVEKQNKVLNQALDIALISYASTCACDVCEGECKNQCVEDIKKEILLHAEKQVESEENGK